MKVFVIEKHGNSEYCSLDQLARDYNITKPTVRNRLNEIRGEIGRRYARLAVIDDGNLVLVNRFVFIDYLNNRRMLKSETQRKYVEPFNATEVARYLGYYSTMEEVKN